MGTPCDYGAPQEVIKAVADDTGLVPITFVTLTLHTSALHSVSPDTVTGEVVGLIEVEPPTLNTASVRLQNDSNATQLELEGLL